jgi:hypothetical protein
MFEEECVASSSIMIIKLDPIHRANVLSVGMGGVGLDSCLTK